MKKTLNYQQHFLVTLTIIQKTNTFFPKKAYLFNTMKLFGNELTSIGLRKVFFFSPFRCEIFQSHKTSTLENNNDCCFFWKKMVFFSEVLEWLFSQKVRRDWFPQLFPLFKYTSVNIYLRVLTNQQLIEHLCIAGNLYKGKMLMINCLTKPFQQKFVLFQNRKLFCANSIKHFIRN